MKRIKQIIESFITIGRDPTKEIRAAWAEVTMNSSAAQDAINLVDRLIGGVLQQAMEMQRKDADDTQPGREAKT